MKCYERTISKREEINKFGRIGYVFYREYFITESEDFLDLQNYCKKIKFSEANWSNEYDNITPNKVYEEKLYVRNRRKNKKFYR